MHQFARSDAAREVDPLSHENARIEKDQYSEPDLDGALIESPELLHSFRGAFSNQRQQFNCSHASRIIISAYQP